MSTSFDVAVIGGGIVGLAHAWRAAERGLRVALFERDAVAQGATVRNFGMIWPIGQPAGELYELALQSAEYWRQLDSLGVVDVELCGSIHLAHRDDESAVLEEFCAKQTHQAGMLSSDEVVRRTRLANPRGLLTGMHSSTELRVDPRTAARQITAWLSETLNVTCHFGTLVTQIRDGEVRAADGRTWRADCSVVCSGSDLQTLYPEILRRSGLRPCKLQMLKTASQRVRREPSPHLASGLSLRHYDSFAGCKSLAALRARIVHETPELDRFGIHVMASQVSTGEIILGDSHEYGDDISAFDKAEIDELIVRELRKVIQLDDWTIRERWHGIYAKHPDLAVFESELTDGVRVFVGTGGVGMTMSFGLAERAWKRWHDKVK